MSKTHTNTKEIQLAEDNLRETFIKPLLQSISPPTVIFLYGNLGSGKTTFVRYLLEELSCTNFAGSPTFNLVNTYTLPNHCMLYHIDLYRTKTGAMQRDLFEFLDLPNDFIACIEWPEKLGANIDLHDFQRVEIAIEYAENNCRKYKLAIK